jgi:acyl-coenzyme A thioesterase PaaI-like protein
MGLSYVSARRQVEPGLGGGAVTLSLAVDYTAAGRVGAWLEIIPRLIKVGGAIGFVDALVTGDGVILARASATFKLLR